MGQKSAPDVVAITGAVTVSEPVTVDGTITATGPLTDAQLRATPVPISGTVGVTEPVSVDDNAGSLTTDTPQLPAALVGGRLDITIGGAPVTITVAATDLDIRNLTATDVITANPATAAGKTLTYVLVNQSVAGTTVLAAASPGNRHKIVGGILVMNLLGALKFTDGGSDLTGPMDIAANGGFVVPMSTYPFQQTAVNSPLNLVTTLGAVRGVITILTEP